MTDPTDPWPLLPILQHVLSFGYAVKFNPLDDGGVLLLVEADIEPEKNHVTMHLDAEFVNKKTLGKNVVFLLEQLQKLLRKEPPYDKK